MPQVLHYEVIVVGAGPAGGVAAYQLARGGCRVLLLEKEKVPRYKACGGAVVRRALEALPFSLDYNQQVIEQSVSRFRLTNDHQQPLVVERRPPVVAMTMRSTLDELIARQAVEAGAELKDHVTLKAVEDSLQRVLCETSAGFFTSDFLIGADGATSLVARSQLEFLPPPCGVALEGEISLADDRVLAEYSGRADFDFHVLPQGYGWVFPKADHLSVGVFTLHTHFPLIKRYYNRYAEKKGLGGHSRGGQVKGHLIPLGPPTRLLNTRRLLLAGDAAGLADPLTGEGISYAVRSGQFAAETLLAALRNPGRSLAAYTQRVREDLWPEIRLARWMARLFYASPDFFYRCFARRELFAQRVLDVFEGKATYRSLLTKARLKPHRLFLG